MSQDIRGPPAQRARRIYPGSEDPNSYSELCPRPVWDSDWEPGASCRCQAPGGQSSPDLQGRPGSS